jgi:hypothetical protein
LLKRFLGGKRRKAPLGGTASAIANPPLRSSRAKRLFPARISQPPEELETGGFPQKAAENASPRKHGVVAILRAGSQIRRVSGKPFGTVWNRFGFDRRKMPIWVPIAEFYGGERKAGRGVALA